MLNVKHVLFGVVSRSSAEKGVRGQRGLGGGGGGRSCGVNFLIFCVTLGNWCTFSR